MKKKMSREERAEFKNGKYMGGPAEERAEKKKAKRMADGGVAENKPVAAPTSSKSASTFAKKNAPGRRTSLPPGLAKRAPGDMPQGLQGRALPGGLAAMKPPVAPTTGITGKGIADPGAPGQVTSGPILGSAAPSTAMAPVSPVAPPVSPTAGLPPGLQGRPLPAGLAAQNPLPQGLTRRQPVAMPMKAMKAGGLVKGAGCATKGVKAHKMY